MDGLFIIGHQNIILYQDYNESLRDKFIELGKANGLLEENFEERELDSDVVMQLLNPIVTSQRIMCSQFDNRYTRLETMGDLGVHYDELFGFLYLKMGSGDVIKEKKILTACREFSRLICGPDIQLLRMDYEKNNLLRNLMKIWMELDAEDQATHLERVEYMVVSREMRNQVFAKIQDSLKNLKEEPHFVHYHGFLFSRGKLLTVYSNRGAKDVSPRDLFHIKILGTQVGGSSSCHLIYLTGVQHFCLPHILFSYRISNTLIFQLVIEYDNSDVADVIFNTLTFLCKIHNYPLDADNIKQMIDRSDMAIKQILEALRNNKLAKVEAERMGKSVDMRWSGMKKKFNELAKNSSYREVTKFFEASLPGLIDCLKLLFKTLFFDTFLTLSSNTLLMEASAVLKSHLDGGIVSESALEQQKAAMKAYIDEYPGLIHFVFVDNTDGRIISPERNWDDTRLLSREKFFSTIDLIAKYKKKGRSSVIWKGPELCFSFFTWYEDECGQYLDPKEVSACPENPTASANYYQKITETLFQRTTTVQRIKSYDLYLIHLGLVNSNLCLEHSRRISMTINDIMGSGGNPLDIL
ncbi:BLOC-3 complex member HPS1 [Lutzomyia longipalpis]|uniref:FUZ/MON1/HPS1 third Longin domain-containing protein n=2 Tax=Lutzomyia longipalpis TaxID=7200 RepID=A0A1B0CLQ7_LUTLO|nr:BLOC-3 complex member HPS1 [Lutzomyia longipalpis]